MPTSPRTVSRSRGRRQRSVSRSGIAYWVDDLLGRGCAEALVAGAAFTRDLAELCRGAEGARTVSLPPAVRRVSGGAFSDAGSLRAAVLGAGVRELGDGAFRGSGLDRIAPLSGLGDMTDCGLEKVGNECFE